MIGTEVLDEIAVVCFDFAAFKSLEAWRERGLRKERPTSNSRQVKGERKNQTANALDQLLRLKSLSRRVTDIMDMEP